jgi:Tol biopolymer transport system component
MKKIVAILALTFAFSACKKEIRDSDKQVQVQPETQSKKPPPPPPNANPAFAFQDLYQVNGNRSVLAIYVMDVTGANKTKVYTNYTNQTTNTPDFPAWSADGSKLCFTLNSADLYTLNFSLVNGVPTGSGATKIGDGVAGGGSYKQGKWRPGANQIACVWKKTGDPDKIHLLPSTGGSPTVLYTAASTDWFIEEDLAFKSDGSSLVFSERQVSSGNVFLKVLDVNTSQVIKTIDLSQYKSVREMDWARSSGSNIVAITTEPRCDNTPIGSGGIHQLQTIDVSASSPSLTLMKNDEGNICWSPDDLQIGVAAGLLRGCGGTGCCFSQYDGKGIYTIATHSYTLPSYSGGNHHDWKR